jgi:hypothetical protein
MHPLAFQKTIPIIFLAEGMVLVSYFEIIVMLFHAGSFYVGVKMVEPAFNTSHNVQQKVIALSYMSLKQLQLHIHAYPFLLICQQSGNPTRTNFPVS